MVHQDLENPNSTPYIKQVEFNTIASSFGGLSSQTSKLHRYVGILLPFANTFGAVIDDDKVPGPNRIW